MECLACHTKLPDDAVFCHACGALQPDARETHDYEYAAFISYRHLPADTKVAIDVQRAIETYRLPKGLDAERPSVAGLTPGDGRSLGKCFRDEDELAASHSLPAHIARALERSRCLIVVCSQDTPQSDWVKREIEAFAQMHGRERIYAVLASGPSATSMPPTMRTHLETDADGTVREVDTEPLAADLRPEAHSKASLEKLRIIAAVASCPLDDLRKRDRSRKRKRTLAAGLTTAFIVAAIAIVLGNFAHVATENERGAQASESLRLAAESTQLLEQGDRYGAIQTALSALPVGGNASRPLVPEAQEALEEALGLNPHPRTLWHAAYSVQAEHSMTLLDTSVTHAKNGEASKASAITVNENGSFFALSDDEGAVTIYDIATGRMLAHCEMPNATSLLTPLLHIRTLAATGDYLVASDSSSRGKLACFESQTGETIWSYDNIALPTIDVSAGPGLATMVQPMEEGGFSVLLMDVAKNEFLAGANFEDERVLPADAGIHAITGKRIADFYCAFGGTLAYARLDTNEARYAELAYPCATSIDYVDGVLVVATASEMPDDGVVRDYAVEAFDDELNLLWKHEGSFTSEMLADDDYVTLLTAEPVVWGFTRDNAGITVSAGRDALVLDAQTGEPTFTRTYDQSIVAMRPVSSEEGDYDRTYIACSNGTITHKDLTGTAQDREGDEERLTLPFPVRWMRIVGTGDAVVTLAIPADGSNRIVAFARDLETPPERTHQLDELVKMAHETLAEGGIAL